MHDRSILRSAVLDNPPIDALRCARTPETLDCAVDCSVGMVARGPHSHGVRALPRDGDHARHDLTIAATLYVTEDDAGVRHLISSGELCQRREDSILRIGSSLLADRVVPEYLDTHYRRVPHVEYGKPASFPHVMS